MSRATSPDRRFRLTRAGVLNVWQYDEQVFDFAEGRLLLRGANGAGKSKTMEMLLPFVLDGDKSRLTASGRHHTSLLWLMLDGYEGSGRTGYLWVELTREADDGSVEAFTCGVGLRATAAAKAATAWYFTSPGRVGVDLHLENEAGPLSHAALVAAFDRDPETGQSRGQVFDNARRYRQHVGERLFGLPLEQYDELLRLIYWLRQPQVGEDIDPKRLAEQLLQALPPVDTDTLRSAGDTFDELEAFGEQIEQRARAAAAIAHFVDTYAGYARSVLAQRGKAALDAAAAVTAARRSLRATERELEAQSAELERTGNAADEARGIVEQSRVRIAALEASPEARSRQQLIELGKRVATLVDGDTKASRLARDADGQAVTSSAQVGQSGRRVYAETQDLARVTDEARQLLGQAGVEVPVAPTAAVLLGVPVWAKPADPGAQADEVRAAGTVHGGWSKVATSAVSRLAAAVSLVEDALREAEEAKRTADAAQGDADKVERRVELDRADVEAARAASAEAEAGFVAALGQWQAHPAAIAFEVPELDADGLATMESRASEAAQPRRDVLSDALGQARAAIATGEQEVVELGTRRAAIEAEVDPTPAPPTWRRDDRRGRPGAPLWRLVDFDAGLGAAQRAGLEAALEGAGLLDAWVTPGGRVEDLPRHDVVVVADAESVGDAEPTGDSERTGPGVLTRSLGDLMHADPPADCGVSADVVDAILGSVGVGASDTDRTEADRAGAAAAFVVDVDGGWRAGLLVGRTSKESAQFVGASARADERARRLAEVDDALVQARSRLDAARAAADDARGALDLLTEWLASRPRHDGVLAAWSTESARVGILDRSESELAEARANAQVERARAAARHAELVTLAELHGLATSAEGLAARRLRLQGAGAAVERVGRRASGLADPVDRWVLDAARARTDADALRDRVSEAEQVHADLTALRAEHEELTRAAGADVEHLERRLAELRVTEREAASQAATLAETIGDLTKRVGALEQKVETERGKVTDSEPLRDAAFETLGSVYAVPGLVEATAFHDEGVVAVGAPTDLDGVRDLVARMAEGRHVDVNAVLQAGTQLQSGPAAHNEPRLVDVAGVYSAIGRDDGGDLPMATLSRKLLAGVASDRELLSERERELFENHVLGQLGEALRGVRRKAQELVTAMNDQLVQVSTSQGIRVRLQWKLRSDIPTEARRAVQLLGEPHGALLPGERVELRESMHRLIDVSRAEAPEQSYAEHLARALDYRQWYAFTVQYHRPETGDWRDLQRRSALSQGEQKVLCYLPLFAAAAAHFTSLAGAARHAPRFVLLDDAFPKIDARTHPLLFGLLVDLDLDFVVTSERLWGTHATVPSLAIYEALRNPAERGIAQYEHRWDGHHLTAVGA